MGQTTFSYLYKQCKGFGKGFETKGFSSLYKHLNLRLLLTNVLNVCFRQELKHENIVSLLDFQVCNVTNVLL